MFGDPKDREWSRDVILSMYPSKTRATIDLKAAHRELREFSAALEEFRLVCTKLATNDEIFAISKKARRLTSIQAPREAREPRRAPRKLTPGNPQTDGPRAV